MWAVEANLFHIVAYINNRFTFIIVVHMVTNIIQL